MKSNQCKTEGVIASSLATCYAAQLEQIKADLIAIVQSGIHGECAICEVMPVLEKHFPNEAATIKAKYAD